MDKSSIKITPLGAGGEVGRSCILADFDNTQIIFDAGIHPGHSGLSTLPYFDLIDLSAVSAVFITHFHLDHAASLPFLTERTNFKGKVFMTHPTKAIFKILLADYIRIVNSSSTHDLYTEDDLKKCYNRIESIDYHQEINIDGLLVSGYNAGHVLGAAMFLVKFGKTKLLYTGDFSREEDRHLKAAELPCKIDILITESTYGVQCHLSREEREFRFLDSITKVVKRGGNALLPVFALGRAQELLLILEESWESNKKLTNYPIFYASLLAKRCLSVYSAYISTMNERIKEIAKTRNPFEFKHILCVEDEKTFIDKQKGVIKTARFKKPHQENNCVMIASPGMLQSGLSRQLFDMWCSDKQNGIVVTGYSVKGTLARDLQSEPAQVETLSGQKKNLKMSVDFISFSAHVDYQQNSSFIFESDAKHVFLVHGDSNEMSRLKNAIERSFKEKDQPEKKVYTLKNGEAQEIQVNKENKVKCINVDVTDSNKFSGIFYRKLDNKILGKKTFSEMTGLEFYEISNKFKIRFGHKKTVVKSLIYSEYKIDEETADYFIADGVKIFLFEDYMDLEWEGGYEKDIVVFSIYELLKKDEELLFNMKMDKDTKLVRVLKNYFEIENFDGLTDFTNFKVVSEGKFVEILKLKIINYDCEQFKEKVEEVLLSVEDIL